MVDRPATILLVDDHWQDIKPLLAGVSRDIAVLTEARAENTIARLEENPEIAVLLLDLLFSDQAMQGEQVYDAVSEKYPHLPIIVLSASTNVGLALRLSQGLGGKKKAYFYFLKDELDRQQFIRTVENAVDWYLLQQTQSRLTDKGSIVSCSPAMDEVLRAIATAAVSDFPVLILGESGTGKELVARAIHRNSKRFGKPFIALNCGALPETLVESELFGTERGAFTGAVDRKGAFQRAQGGILFLDEIGEMPLEQQPKLLRALESKEIVRVGGQRAVQVDIRLIASTNRDLKSAIAAKKFREDLFYRLDVLRINVPPLRNRREDIPILAEHFINLSQPGTDVTADALELLRAYPWPGNVRELQNVLNRAIASSKGDLLDAQAFAGLTHPVSAEDGGGGGRWIDRVLHEEIGWTDLMNEFKGGSQAVRNILEGIAAGWKEEHDKRISGDDFARLLRINRNHINQILKQHSLRLKDL